MSVSIECTLVCLQRTISTMEHTVHITYLVFHDQVSDIPTRLLDQTTSVFKKPTYETAQHNLELHSWRFERKPTDTQPMSTQGAVNAILLSYQGFCLFDW